MSVTKDEFRAALGRFATGVTVVTCSDREGQPAGITVSAFSSLSLDPPLVVICIDHRASIHDLLAVGSPLAVNVLTSDQETVSRAFASRDGERFAGLGYRLSTSRVALLDGVLAALECRVTALQPGGDHTIVVAEVERAHLGDGRPLLYFRGGYAQLG